MTRFRVSLIGCFAVASMALATSAFADRAMLRISGAGPAYGGAAKCRQITFMRQSGLSYGAQTAGKTSTPRTNSVEIIIDSKMGAPMRFPTTNHNFGRPLNATITYYRRPAPGAPMQPYMTVALKNVEITKFAVSGNGRSPNETLALAFRKMSVKYVLGANKTPLTDSWQSSE